MTKQAIVGMRAPEFSLWAVNGLGVERREVSLDEYFDRWLVLLFYPRDFSLICPTELTTISDRIEKFTERGCDVLGISTDSIETHERWLTTPPEQAGLGAIQFPLASDPEGTVCQRYGVYIKRQHLALRGMFIIDPNGVLQYQVVHSLSVGRNIDELLRVLDAIQSGGMCTAEHEISKSPMDVLSVLGPNRVIGQYEIEAELGTGAFGKVFRARDVMLDRKVALKVLRPSDGEPMESLLTEARAAAALNHPNVCTVYSVDTANGVPMIVMEYVDGQPLWKKLTSGPISHDDAAELTRQIATGMAASHAANVVHGDLKPANLMVTTDGKIKVMDFGLARRIQPTQSLSETVDLDPSSGSGLSGTPAYMAPELTRGESPTPASDVFALGLIIYEMLSGKPAISGKNILDAFHKIQQFNPSKCIAELPHPFADILRESLVSEATQRRISMSEIADMLA